MGRRRILCETRGFIFVVSFSELNNLNLRDGNFQQQQQQAQQVSPQAIEQSMLDRIVGNGVGGGGGGVGGLSLNHQQQQPPLMMPHFMRHWDETSEIHNYGLFGPGGLHPVQAEINTCALDNGPIMGNGGGGQLGRFSEGMRRRSSRFSDHFSINRFLSS